MHSVVIIVVQSVQDCGRCATMQSAFSESPYRPVPHRPFHKPLKLIDCLRATRWTPPDYWQTDSSSGLVMVIRNYHWLNSASRVLILICSAPLVQTGERNNFHCLTLTYDLDLQSQASQGQDRPSCQKSRSEVKQFKQESAHRQTDGHTHGR